MRWGKRRRAWIAELEAAFLQCMNDWDTWWHERHKDSSVQDIIDAFNEIRVQIEAPSYRSRGTAHAANETTPPRPIPRPHPLRANKWRVQRAFTTPSGMGIWESSHDGKPTQYFLTWRQAMDYATTNAVHWTPRKDA